MEIQSCFKGQGCGSIIDQPPVLAPCLAFTVLGIWGSLVILIWPCNSASWHLCLAGNYPRHSSSKNRILQPTGDLFTPSCDGLRYRMPRYACFGLDRPDIVISACTSTHGIEIYQILLRAPPFHLTCRVTTTLQHAPGVVPIGVFPSASVIQQKRWLPIFVTPPGVGMSLLGRCSGQTADHPC